MMAFVMEEREERDTGPRGACELSDWKGRGGCVWRERMGKYGIEMVLGQVPPGSGKRHRHRHRHKHRETGGREGELASKPTGKCWHKYSAVSTVNTVTTDNRWGGGGTRYSRGNAQ